MDYNNSNQLGTSNTILQNQTNRFCIAIHFTSNHFMAIKQG